VPLPLLALDETRNIDDVKPVTRQRKKQTSLICHGVKIVSECTVVLENVKNAIGVIKDTSGGAS